MKVPILIGLMFLILLVGSVSATDWTCNSCATCNTAIQSNASAGDTVKLNASITGQNGDCLQWNNDDDGVAFDCDGYTLGGDFDSNGDAIAFGDSFSLFAEDIIVQNCHNITGWNKGVGGSDFYYRNVTLRNLTFIDNAEGGIAVSADPSTAVDFLVEDVRFYNNDRGMEMVYWHNTVARNIDCFNNTGGCIFISEGDNVTYENIYSLDDCVGFKMEYSQINITVINATIVNASSTYCGGQAYKGDGINAKGSADQFIWNDITILNPDDDGIDFAAGAWTGDTWTVNNLLIQDSGDVGIVMGSNSNNKLMNFTNITIIRPTGDGVETQSGTYPTNVLFDNLTVIDCGGVSDGMSLQNQNWTIRNSHITGCDNGLRMEGAIWHWIYSNNISGNDEGISEGHGGGSTNIWVYDNIFDNTDNFINDTNTAESFRFNTTKTLGTNILGGAYIGGNAWSDYTGTDGDADGIGDTSYDVNGVLFDFLPLTLATPPPTPPLNNLPAPFNAMAAVLIAAGYILSLIRFVVIPKALTPQIFVGVIIGTIIAASFIVFLLTGA